MKMKKIAPVAIQCRSALVWKTSPNQTALGESRDQPHVKANLRRKSLREISESTALSTRDRRVTSRRGIVRKHVSFKAETRTERRNCALNRVIQSRMRERVWMTQRVAGNVTS
jgi:hypothetical protein